MLTDKQETGRRCNTRVEDLVPDVAATPDGWFRRVQPDRDAHPGTPDGDAHAKAPDASATPSFEEPGRLAPADRGSSSSVDRPHGPDSYGAATALARGPGP